MIKIFIPAVKGKQKTLARGFWQNPEGKIYYDYLIQEKFNNKSSVNLHDYLHELKIKYSQECMFYKNNNIGNIFYSKDKIQILPHRIYKEVLRKDLKKTIKTDLKKYSGLTVYIINKKYFIEVFTTL